MKNTKQLLWFVIALMGCSEAKPNTTNTTPNPTSTKVTVPTSKEWGPSCKALIEKVESECKQYGTKGLWPQICPKYLEGLGEMKGALPPNGAPQAKINEADIKCAETLETYNTLTKETLDFPR
jgi:hypothetical protein